MTEHVTETIVVFKGVLPLHTSEGVYQQQIHCISVDLKK